MSELTPVSGRTENGNPSSPNLALQFIVQTQLQLDRWLCSEWLNTDTQVSVSYYINTQCSRRSRNYLTMSLRTAPTGEVGVPSLVWSLERLASKEPQAGPGQSSGQSSVVALLSQRAWGAGSQRTNALNMFLEVTEPCTGQILLPVLEMGLAAIAS